MQINDIAKLSTRMFKTNPARTWLTIMGMGVGIGAVVTLVGLGFGLQNIIIGSLVEGDTLLSLNVTNPPGKIVVLNDETVQEILAIENVRDVAPMVSLPALITFEGFTGNTSLQGSSAAYFKYVGTKMSEGEVFNNEDNVKNPVVITKAILKLFEVPEEEIPEVIGKEVTFRVFVPIGSSAETEEVEISDSFTIIGVTADENDISAMIRLEQFSERLPTPMYEKVQVRVNKIDNLGITQDVIIEKGFTVTALSKIVDQTKKIFVGLQAVLAVFGGIALTVSAIGMFNTMTVTLLERTGEIGIMRTLGASSGDIKILFISEAVIVGFLGGVTGIMMGVGIGLVLNTMMNVAASNFGGQSMSLFYFPTWFLMFILSFAGIVGFMTGVFPAKRAASLNPLDAIRYK